MDIVFDYQKIVLKFINLMYAFDSPSMTEFFKAFRIQDYLQRNDIVP